MSIFSRISSKIKNKKPAKVPDTEKNVGKKTSKKKVITSSSIINDLEICLKLFFKLLGKEYIVNDFSSFNLSSTFNSIEMYDFEIMVEEMFFDSKDIIPDGLLTDIQGYVKFIENSDKVVINENSVNSKNKTHNKRKKSNTALQY